MSANRAASLLPFPSPRGAAAPAYQPKLTVVGATRLAEVFTLLANRTRLELVHAVAAEGELSLTVLANRVGRSVLSVSPQVRLLVSHGILVVQRAGNNRTIRLAARSMSNL